MDGNTDMACNIFPFATESKLWDALQPYIKTTYSIVIKNILKSSTNKMEISVREGGDCKHFFSLYIVCIFQKQKRIGTDLMAFIDLETTLGN